MGQAEQCIRKGYGECFDNTQLEQIVKFGKEDIVFTLEKATEGTSVDLKKLQDSCEVIKGVTSAVGPHLWSGVNIFGFVHFFSGKIMSDKEYVTGMFTPLPLDFGPCGYG